MTNEITYSNWEQLRLIPPSTIRVELVCFVDGPTDSATLGFKVTDADTDDMIALGCNRPVSHGQVYFDLTAMAEELLKLARAHLSPF